MKNNVADVNAPRNYYPLNENTADKPLHVSQFQNMSVPLSQVNSCPYLVDYNNEN